ncbi:MAG: PhzF family phenazine biosynthesis protein [Rhodospirillaceae bacterium]
MECAFVTLDVFTDRVFGGNPLAVVLDGQLLSDAQMQSVAREFNLSETTFVLPPTDGRSTHRVRIFTPMTELKFAGHPTLGTAVALALRDEATQDQYHYTFEEGIGVVPVSVFRSGSDILSAKLSVAQLPIQLEQHISQSAWAEILSLDIGTFDQEKDTAELWSCGTPFSFVQLNSLADLDRASVNMSAWQHYLSDRQTSGVFVFTTETKEQGIDVRARMFAPAHGIPEDPATGSAVAALAGWLVDHEPAADGEKTWTIAQGVEMGRSSLLRLEADIKGGGITGVRVGGCAVPVSRGVIKVF